MTGLNCKVLDQDAFRRAGGTVTSDMCELDGATDPVAVLRTLAGSPKGPQVRYVPVRK